MALQPVLINGEWRQATAPIGSFRTVNPATRDQLPDEFPISTVSEIESAIQAAYDAVVALRSVSPEQIAAFLDAYAANIEACADVLVDTANLETALPKEP